jgi:hypothetical protein
VGKGAVVGGGLCGGFGAGRAGGVWGLLLGGEKGALARDAWRLRKSNRAFTDGKPKTITMNVTSQTKTAKVESA